MSLVYSDSYHSQCRGFCNDQQVEDLHCPAHFPKCMNDALLAHFNLLASLEDILMLSSILILDCCCILCRVGLTLRSLWKSGRIGGVGNLYIMYKLGPRGRIVAVGVGLGPD